MFDKIVITPATGSRVIKIDASGVSSGAKYVGALKVNGAKHSQSWLDSSFARPGGTLDFTMTKSPGTWGTAATDVPPSFTNGTNFRNSVGTTRAAGATSARSTSATGCSPANSSPLRASNPARPFRAPGLLGPVPNQVRPTTGSRTVSASLFRI